MNGVEGHLEGLIQDWEKEGILLRLVVCWRFGKFELVEFWNCSYAVWCMDIPLSGSENGLG